MTAKKRRPITLAAGLTIAFLVLTVTSSLRQSATSDETVHLAAGYSYLRWNDYRLNPEHPPLMKKLSALPLLLLPLWPDSPNPAGEALGESGFLSTRRMAAEAWALSAENIDFQWPFAWAFLYGLRDEALLRVGAESALLAPTEIPYHKEDFLNDADEMLFLGRLVPSLAGALLAILVFCWSLELFGPVGAALSMLLFCFDPNFIAHSGLVTTDVSVSLFIFGAIYFLWKWRRRPSAVNSLLAALFTALTFATKFSAVLLLPIFVLIALLSGRPPGTEPGSRPQGEEPPAPAGARSLLALFAVSLMASYFMIWTVYGFRYSATRDPHRAAEEEYRLTGNEEADGRLPLRYVVRENAALKDLLQKWPDGDYPGGLDALEEAALRTPPDLDGRLLLWASRNRLLPEAYIYGFAYVRNRSLARVSYLRGQHSKVGFRSYLPWAFVLKTPLVTMALIFLALLVALRERRTLREHLPYLLAPVLVYGFFAVTSRLSIGHRHLFPVYPFLFVLCGVLAIPWQRCSWRAQRISAAAVAAAVILGAFLVFSPPWRPTFVYPHFLTYFNELAGGPGNGYRSLVDSNLDWGQGLKELKRWLEERGVEEPINLCYFGNADPRYHGIRHVNMPGGYDYAPRSDFSAARRPGYLAISATKLEGAYFTAEGRAAWKDFIGEAPLVDTVGNSIFVYRLEGKD